MNSGSLANSGNVTIGEGATLNLTGQPNGITNATAGSQLYIEGSFKAGAASGLAKLGSVEGLVAIENNQSTSITPASGTLTVSNTGVFDVEHSSNVTISGAVSNSGEFETNRFNLGGGDTVTVTGALTNSASGVVLVGNNNNTTDVLNVGTLANGGAFTVGEGATLDLTSSGTSTNSTAINLESATMKISGASATLNGAGTVTLLGGQWRIQQFDHRRQPERLVHQREYHPGLRHQFPTWESSTMARSSRTNRPHWSSCRVPSA